MRAVIILSLVWIKVAVASDRPQPIYTNQFAVHVPKGKEYADTIADRHGFINIGQIGSLKGFYLLEHRRLHKRSLNHSHEHHELLSAEDHVQWFQQQREKRRVKRDGNKRDIFTGNPFISTYDSDFSSALFAHRHSANRNHYRSGGGLNSFSFPDPLYKEEWYLNGGAKDGYDMNVAPAWAKGYTGKGVVVSILDDGIQTNHPDLAANYDPAASTDINDNDDDPMPRDNGDNKHGTRCAGEVAAVAFNSFCGIGVAYNASIGGVRMLDGSVNDAVEARALSLNPDHIDIYSASWGPEDDGKTVDGPGPLARRAFINGVTTGRKGRGSIFVWASGNGGRHTDSCNCDGYTNSIFTLSISSATQGGYKPWYLEECSSTLATTYSSGTPGHDKSIATVDMDGKLRSDHICTVEHTGTSASAPLASGLCALALEANPELSWRDMQHIVVMTSNPAPLLKESGWITNGVNRKVSHKFGYGLMDGAAMVNLAEQWTSVPPQHICKSQEVIEDRAIDPSFSSVLTVAVDASGCPGTVNEVRYVEHVQCKVSLRFFPRGNLRLVLTSPKGTPSTLLMERPRDVVSSNFDDWPFLSVHYWGENPRGRWTLQVINAGNRHVNQPGILRKWQLIFYGTVSDPVRLRLPQSSTTNQDFTFPSVSPPLSSFFPSAPSQDIFSGFRNLPNIFTASGSANSKTKVSMELNELAEGERCHESCATCAGSTQDSCLTCAPGHLYMTDLGLCLQRCPDGYYEDPVTNSCIGCYGNCASCPEHPSICGSCDHHLILYNGSCVTSCPKGTFETDDYRCGECDTSCETCLHDGTTGCVTCKGDIRAGPSGKCHNKSFECPPHCVLCTHQEDICSECSAGYIIDINGDCVIDDKSCKPGEYTTTSGCEPCENINNCTKCPPGLNIINNTCVAFCGTGYYSDSGWCRPCSDHCAECLGDRQDQCLSCMEEYKFASGYCVESCPSGTYKTQWGCLKCHHFCNECSSEGPYACTACSSGRYLDAATKLCMPCHPCNGSNTHQCCHCDPTTGKCHLPAGKRRITSEQAAKAHEDELLAEASSAHHFFTKLTSNNHKNEFTGTTLVTIASCAVVVALFGLIFTVLQLRSRDGDRRGGYMKVPIQDMNFSTLGEKPRNSKIRFSKADPRISDTYSDEDEEQVALNIGAEKS
uniref:furin n=1 Tax=Panstrongylus lignarius TaxID=156445 RepID=A0A224XI33_9HEMI